MMKRIYFAFAISTMSFSSFAMDLPGDRDKTAVVACTKPLMECIEKQGVLLTESFALRSQKKLEEMQRKMDQAKALKDKCDAEYQACVDKIK